MAAVEEGVRMTRCHGEEATPCVAGQRCLTHGLWDALGEQIAVFLASITLADVIEGIPAAKQARRLAVGAGHILSAEPVGVAAK
jgi:DNA-binding IscR family transcriptional regulator